MTLSSLHPWCSVLAWALIHFLWEGALAGLLAWGSLRLARDRRPETRYLIAYGFLLLMAGTFLATLWVLAGTGSGLRLSPIQEASQGAMGLPGLHGLTLLQRGLDAALPAVLLGWGLGVCLMLGRMGSGYWWLHAICLQSARPADPVWQARLDRLAQTLGLPPTVQLRWSDKLDTPLVLGTLRPMILCPCSAMLGLDPMALETVLAHELAHIRRHDYLANLFQSLLESLFFYHPAFWWLSRQIRLERELCCDDAAVRSCGDALLYASALAGLEALRTPKPYFSHLAPAAKGGPLMLRIRRILTPTNHLPAASAPVPLLTGLALVLAVTLFCHHLQARTPAQSSQAQAAPAPKTVPFTSVEVAHQPKPPAYPAEAKANRIQGTVVVEVTIDAHGTPVAAKAIEGPDELRATAEDYASKWQFKPVLEKGKAIPARFALTMPFKLR